jgi:hypothetical protein
VTLRYKAKTADCGVEVSSLPLYQNLRFTSGLTSTYVLAIFSYFPHKHEHVKTLVQGLIYHPVSYPPHQQWRDNSCGGVRQ